MAIGAVLMSLKWNFGRMVMLSVLLAGGLAMASCQKQEQTERPPEPGDIAVARVDGHTIWSSDVRNEAVAQGQIGPGEPLDMTSDLFSRTLEEVGRQFKVTRERIRQIEAKALRKMRHPTRIRQLEGFLEAHET